MTRAMPSPNNVSNRVETPVKIRVCRQAFQKPVSPSRWEMLVHPVKLSCCRIGELSRSDIHRVRSTGYNETARMTVSVGRSSPMPATTSRPGPSRRWSCRYGGPGGGSPGVRESRGAE
jgi:hypothetical protein